MRQKNSFRGQSISFTEQIIIATRYNRQETKNCDHDRRREIRKSDDIGEDRAKLRILSEGFYRYGRTDGQTL